VPDSIATKAVDQKRRGLQNARKN